MASLKHDLSDYKQDFENFKVKIGNSGKFKIDKIVEEVQLRNFSNLEENQQPSFRYEFFLSFLENSSKKRESAILKVQKEGKPKLGVNDFLKQSSNHVIESID